MKKLILLITLLGIANLSQSQKCSYLYNVDYFGNDLSESIVPTIDECCSLCSKTAQCNAWTYLYSNNKCFLKYGVGEIRTVSSGPVFSGIVNKNTTPVEPRKCSFQGNFDYIGNDLYGYEQRMNSMDECCALCIKTQGCAAWTFLNYTGWTQGKCFLKSSTGEKAFSAGGDRQLYSGIVTN
ncbi:unnamed protein product [Brachionus calyciflorus]|uniref:Apple domain-containing protein n=1 Tax=Brachionus calyciflorus TaxID=104777 RepID=A0A814G057_9BILA|nr:unnamed protein product [Brachionus calyciflorus]